MGGDWEWEGKEGKGWFDPEKEGSGKEQTRKDATRRGEEFILGGSEEGYVVCCKQTFGMDSKL